MYCNIYIFRDDTHRKRTVEEPKRSANFLIAYSDVWFPTFKFPYNIGNNNISPCVADLCPSLHMRYRRGRFEDNDCSPAFDEDERDSGATTRTYTL
jgi:hypothetical protein